MKKVISISLIVFTGAVLATPHSFGGQGNAFELDTMSAKDVNKVMKQTMLAIPEPVKVLAQSPYHAAEQLREELRLRGVLVNVTVVQMSPKRAMLVAEFPSWKVFKEVQDVFTTDDHGNLFYMGYPFRPQVPREKQGQDPYQAAKQLRKELRDRGVNAKVIVQEEGEEEENERVWFLVEFPSENALNKVKDIFTTNEHEDLFYMGYYVFPRLPNEKIPETLSVKAPRTIFSCQAVKVYDTSFFEESLSVEEYPDVSMTEDRVVGKKVYIGASLFSERERDSIQITHSAESDINVTVKPSNDETVYSIAIRQYNSGTGLKKEGMVSAGKPGYSPVKVAKLACE